MQVLIRVCACGVNPVETYIRSGSYARKPTLPYTPGSDVAGVVDAVGEGVTAVKVTVNTPLSTYKHSNVLVKFNLVSMMECRASLFAEKSLQTMIVPPPYITICMKIFSCYALRKTCPLFWCLNKTNLYIQYMSKGLIKVKVVLFICDCRGMEYRINSCKSQLKDLVYHFSIF